MAKLSRMGLLASGAVAFYLTPKLAMDARVDVAPLFEGVNAKNFGEKRGVITERFRLATAGKLAQDADVNDLASLLDALEARTDEAQDDEPEKKPDLRSFLMDRLSPEDMAACDELMQAQAEDEDNAERRDNESEGAALKDREEREHAMDAAIQGAVQSAVQAERARAREAREAEVAVRPYVGNLAVAMDTAEDVYRAALSALGVDTKGVHASALPHILKAQPLPGAQAERRKVIAQDSKASGSFFEMFPDANKNFQVAH